MSGSDLVPLRGGAIVSVQAVELALDLERRGCRLERDGYGILVGPRDRITDEDRVRIRQWKPQLIALIAYCEAIQ